MNVLTRSVDEDALDIFSRSRLTWSSSIRVGDRDYDHQTIVRLLAPQFTEDRLARLRQVVAGRTRHFVPIIENPYDLGNVSAVMRSSEAFGFLDVNLMIPPGSRFKAANRVARGADKWLDIQMDRSPAQSVARLRERGFKIYASSLEAAEPIDTLDFSQKCAVVLGNEKDGVSPEMLELADRRFFVPMQGFTKSFNISVAAAIIFYHVWQNRVRVHGRSGDLSEQEQDILLANYYLRSIDNPGPILVALT
jgi:tRNA (guanosine-2'-O-)-methyltransferase